MLLKYSIIHILCRRLIINEMTDQSIILIIATYAPSTCFDVYVVIMEVYTKAGKYSTHTHHTMNFMYSYFIYLLDDDHTEVETCRRRVYYFYNLPSGCCVGTLINVKLTELN
jgi:hypothetical protein